ncbi:MAG: hypothetical protein DMG58_13365 [Acidobacteria bacterium]|nr:MAG: hypothetical protein DMG58_13365 [Acidobacteriota bacterium]
MKAGGNVETDAGILVDAATLTDVAIPVVAATPADESTTVGAATPAGAATTVAATMIADGDGAAVTGIVAVVASASATTPHLTRMAPAIPTTRTTAIPTATTINGAIGILQSLVATPNRTRDINAAR